MQKVPVKLLAWLLLPLIPNLGAGQQLVLCFESDGHVVIEAGCSPKVCIPNLTQEKDYLKNDHVGHCVECSDIRLGIGLAENAAVLKAQPVPSGKLFTSKPITSSLNRIPQRDPSTFYKYDIFKMTPSRLALRAAILLI